MTLESFFTDYVSQTEPNPFAKYERVWQVKAALDLRQFGGNVRFSLRALDRGKGYGSEALDWLCALADEHGIMLTGDAVPFGTIKPQLTKVQLKKWYARHGFQVSRRGELARLPKRVKNFDWVCNGCQYRDDPAIPGKPTICPKCGCNNWREDSGDAHK